jgi:hypothetical protein
MENVHMTNRFCIDLCKKSFFEKLGLRKAGLTSFICMYFIKKIELQSVND